MKTKEVLQSVKRLYSTIAHEFDATRDRPWPEFEVFLKRIFMMSSSRRRESGRFPIKSGMTLLDIGCGNGRLSHFLKNEPINYTGVDNNRTMLGIAKKKNPKATFRYADACKLPFHARSFDTVWAVALLHHLPTKKFQFQALKEMKRVLKPGGLLCLMVWNLWQKKYKKYIDAKNHHAQIPWGKDKKILRYYYAFRSDELRELLKKAGLHSVKKLRSEHNFAYVCNS